MLNTNIWFSGLLLAAAASAHDVETCPAVPAVTVTVTAGTVTVTATGSEFASKSALEIASHLPVPMKSHGVHYFNATGSTATTIQFPTTSAPFSTGISSPLVAEGAHSNNGWSLVTESVNGQSAGTGSGSGSTSSGSSSGHAGSGSSSSGASGHQGSGSGSVSSGSGSSGSGGSGSSGYGSSERGGSGHGGSGHGGSSGNNILSFHTPVSHPLIEISFSIARNRSSWFNRAAVRYRTLAPISPSIWNRIFAFRLAFWDGTAAHISIQHRWLAPRFPLWHRIKPNWSHSLRGLPHWSNP